MSKNIFKAPFFFFSSKIQKLTPLLRLLEPRAFFTRMAGIQIFLYTLSAILEGLTFAFIFAGLYVISGNTAPIEKFNIIASFISLPIQLNPGQSFQNFIVFLLIAISLQILRSFSQFVAKLKFSKLSNRMNEIVVHQIQKQIFSFDFPFISNIKVGEISSAAKIPFEALSQFANAIFDSIQILLMIVILGGILFYLSPFLTVIVFSIVCFTLFIQRKIMNRATNLSIKHSSNLNEYLKLFTQVVSGIRVITTFHRFEFFNKKINEQVAHITKGWYQLAKHYYIIQPLNEIIAMIVIGSCAVVGFFLFKNHGNAGSSLFITFMTVLVRLANRMPSLMHGVGELANKWGELSRLIRMIDPQGKQYVIDGKISLTTFSNKIEFKSISHEYEPMNPVLSNVNLKIQEGDSVAFVGKSGSGKSTLIDLLIRLYEPSQGEILINNYPLSSLKIQSWRDRLGVVSQDTFIFNDTVFENVCFGLPDVRRDELEQALDASGCTQFIKKMPQGIHSILGERGYRLSGGEKQRIALARALLRNPDVLILDEATSALDTKTERFIMNTIEEFFGKKTVIIIAHRLSTIIHCDHIYLIDHGKIIEEGTHEKLLLHNGHYSKIWNAQTKHKDPIFA